jgi:retinol dehydrogenase 12
MTRQPTNDIRRHLRDPNVTPAIAQNGTNPTSTLARHPYCSCRGGPALSLETLSGHLAVDDKHILITGAPNGIGLAAAEALAARGANLAIVGRSETRTPMALARIEAAAARGATVVSFVADLSSQTSLRKLAGEVLARYPKLNVLVNNAGAMYSTHQLSKDGIELTWAVNHLRHFC